MRHAVQLSNCAPGTHSQCYTWGQQVGSCQVFCGFISSCLLEGLPDRLRFSVLLAGQSVTPLELGSLLGGCVDWSLLGQQDTL
jgi:hypothetical protein